MLRTPHKLAQYLLKEHPLTRSGKPGVSTVADLLFRASRGDTKAQELFLELEAAKFNRAAFTPTPGLSEMTAPRVPRFE